MKKRMLIPVLLMLLTLLCLTAARAEQGLLIYGPVNMQPRRDIRIMVKNDGTVNFPADAVCELYVVGSTTDFAEKKPYDPAGTVFEVTGLQDPMVQPNLDKSHYGVSRVECYIANARIYDSTGRELANAEVYLYIGQMPLYDGDPTPLPFPGDYAAPATPVLTPPPTPAPVRTPVPTPPPTPTPVPTLVLTPPPTPTPSPAPLPTKVPTPPPTQAPAQSRTSITFGAKVPQSHFASYSDEFDPSFTVTLYSDGTATLFERMMEEAGNYSLTWSWSGSTLSLHGYWPNEPVRVTFRNGKGTYDFYGDKVEVTLPKSAPDFFTAALGYVPEGVPGGAPAAVTPPPAAVTPVPDTRQPSVGGAGLKPIPGWAGAWQVPVRSVQATSYIVSKKDPTLYAPQRMLDGDEHTSFQFRTSVTPLGREYLYFEMEQPSAFDELWIKNGFWTVTNGYDQYFRNSRIKTMVLSYRYAGQTEYRDDQLLTLEDLTRREDWTRIRLPDVATVTGVRICILDAYIGTKFPNDVCVSEIMFVHTEPQ